MAAIFFAAATLSVARLDAAEDRGTVHRSDAPAIERPSFVRSVRTVAARPGPALVIVDFLSQALVRGMLITLIVVSSLELLGLGDAGIGWLNAAIGLGGLVGAVAAASLIGRVRLSRQFALSLALWGLPIAIMGAWPLPLVALGAMVVTGFSNASLDIAGFTVLQRSFPPRERFAAFGLLEGAGGMGIALGGILGSVLVDLVGIRGALGLAGGLLPIMAVATWPRISRLELESLVPEERLALLRHVPLFAPLNLSTLERVASAMVPADVAAGEVLMREGDVGDRYLVIETGRADVSAQGSPSARVRTRRRPGRDRAAPRRAAHGDGRRDRARPGPGARRGVVQGRDGRAGRLGGGRGDHRRSPRDLGGVPGRRQRLTPRLDIATARVRRWRDAIRPGRRPAGVAPRRGAPRRRRPRGGAPSRRRPGLARG